MCWGSEISVNLSSVFESRVGGWCAGTVTWSWTPSQTSENKFRRMQFTPAGRWTDCTSEPQHKELKLYIPGYHKGRLSQTIIWVNRPFRRGCVYLRIIVLSRDKNTRKYQFNIQFWKKGNEGFCWRTVYYSHSPMLAPTNQLTQICIAWWVNSIQPWVDYVITGRLTQPRKSPQPS